MEDEAAPPVASRARSTLAWLVLPRGAGPGGGAMEAAEGGWAKEDEEEVRLRVRLPSEDEEERCRRADVGSVGHAMMWWCGCCCGVCSDWWCSEGEVEWIEGGSCGGS